MDVLFSTEPLIFSVDYSRCVGRDFLSDGAQKVLGWFGGPGLKNTVGHFTSMGMPAPLAYMVAFIEFLSGVGLIVGFLARLCGLGVAVVMIGAITTVHWQHGFFINFEMKPGKGHGIEYNLALLAIGLATRATLISDQNSETSGHR